MTATILRGNALALPVADESVDLIVTSPPYFGLRSYQDGGEHYAGQIGSEPTPGEFVDALIAATAEMVRVLKPSGSIWVNLGDKYVSPGGHTDRGAESRLAGRRADRQQARPERGTYGMRAKSLMGIPWRYALRCIGNGTALGNPDLVRLLLRDVALGVISLAEAERIVDDLHATPDPGLGLILRAEVIWSKPNGLPESVTDRVRRSHEQWFHFTKSPRYYSATDAIRESSGPAKSRGRNPNGPSPDPWDRGTPTVDPNPLGKLPGSVWSIPTQPLTVPAHLGVDHFAAFPLEWPRRIITGWSPSGICTACGDGRRHLVDAPTLGTNGNTREPGINGLDFTGQEFYEHRARHPRRIIGSTCGCPEPTAPTRPAVVLDPFGGTGTVALMADVLGRDGISVDMSADYCRLARWRTTDPGERARAMQVEKPDAPPDGMDSLLDLLAEESAS